jgi:hypothetical protein
VNELAAKYRALGLSVIPIGDGKRPIVKWLDAQKAITEYDFTPAKGVGLVCGKVSGNIEAIDFDLKYDITGTLMTRYRECVDGVDLTLLKRLLMQKTPSGGFHFIYRCEKIAGNQKLAQRRANDEEAARGEKILVLIETRGEGGYIGIAPSEGYRFVHGLIDSIPTITPEERDILIGCAQSFNEVFREMPVIGVKSDHSLEDSPIDDYNKRGDAVSLLCKHGWTVSGRKGVKTLMKRPGQTSAAHSGNYDAEKGWFTVFSTSTEFEPQTAYRPASIFCKLECSGDWTETAKRLVNEGYGKKKERELPVEQKLKIKTVEAKVKPDDLSFIVGPDEYEADLQRIALGNFPMGLTTGIRTLDEYFLLKRGYLNIVNGFDNVGKTVALWYLALLSSLLHGWKWGIQSAENTPTSFFRKMTEFYWGEPYLGMNEMKRKKALDYLTSHFYFIRSDSVFNYVDTIQMIQNLKDKKGISGFLIDPWNSLESIGGSTANRHSNDNSALIELQVLVKTQDVTIFINAHSVTSTYRMKDADGRTPAPKKGDTEGGTKFASKAFDFLTFHRHVDDPAEYRKMEIYVRKVKETETGGRVSPFTTPIILEMVNSVSYVDVNGRDAVKEWRSKDPQTTLLPLATSTKPNTQFLTRYEPKAFDDDDDALIVDTEQPVPF